MTNKEYRYFNIAKEVSLLSEYDKIKIGSILVNKHDIIATGFNKIKSHPLQKKRNIKRFTDTLNETCKNRIHAELDCLIKIPKHIDLSRAVIYNYRDNKDGLQNSRPCEACMDEIRRRGIRTIYYTTTNGYCREDLL